MLLAVSAVGGPESRCVMATLLQLKAFLAVVDQGGFTAASRSLGMSQPAVNRAVAGLERELGSPLLIRHRDRILLNAPGKRALAHARSAVRHLDQMRAEVSAAAKLRGTLRIASLPYTTELLIARSCRSFPNGIHLWKSGCWKGVSRKSATGSTWAPRTQA